VRHSKRGFATLGFALLIALSCTRMPTAPPVEITIQGRITGPEGEPMPDTSVDFYPRDPTLTPWDNSTFGWTDSTGTYSVRLSTGTYEVRIDPGAGGFLTHIDQVRFTRSSKRYDHAFRGYKVSGAVRDPSGGVVDSGAVAARFLYSQPTRYAQTRVVNGAYSLVLPEGLYDFDAVGHHWSGVPPLRLSTVSVRNDTIINLDFAGIEVSGTVLGRDGAPLDEIVVEAVETSRLWLRTQTGPDGRYRIWVRPGTYTFRFWRGGIVPRTTGPIEVTAPIQVDGDLSGPEWTGTVLWRSTREPVPGAWARAEAVTADPPTGASSETDVSGTFRVILEPNRRYDLRVRHDNAATFEVENIRAQTDTTFEILLDPAPGP